MLKLCVLQMLNCAHFLVMAGPQEPCKVYMGSWLHSQIALSAFLRPEIYHRFPTLALPSQASFSPGNIAATSKSCPQCLHSSESLIFVVMQVKFGV